MSHSLSSRLRPARPVSPATWWRQICWVTPRIAASGDLPGDRANALIHLNRWVSAGITHVIDLREESNDSRFVETNSNISYHWFGVDDNGTRRKDTWFDNLTETATQILLNPNSKILVHCHMGVNRGPSALFAILLALGWDDLNALRAIRNARPIAAVLYAPDATRWHAVRTGATVLEVKERVSEVKAWLDRNYLDLGYVIDSIGNRLAG